MKSRLLASALASVLVPAAFVATAVPATAEAAPVQEAQCLVHAVHASKEGDGTIPDELKFLEEQLRDDQFAAYKSFRLIEQEAMQLSLGKPSEVRFTTGNKLGLSLLGNDDKHLKLRASFTKRDGKKPLVNTEIRIEDAGVLIIVAGDFVHMETPGKVLFAIQCKRKAS